MYQLRYNKIAPVAQLDRAMDFESKGCAFKSRQAHQEKGFLSKYLQVKTNRNLIKNSGYYCRTWNC